MAKITLQCDGNANGRQPAVDDARDAGKRTEVLSPVFAQFKVGVTHHASL